MGHSKTCDEQHEASKRQQRDWLQQWPGTCKSCYGHGGREIPQTYWEPGDFDPCEDCVCQGKCARCGKEFDTENDNPCPHCGWNWGKNLGDYAPSPYECYGDCQTPIEEDVPF